MIELTADLYNPYSEKMEKSVENLQSNMHAVRAGRANPHVLDRITVEYYGTETPLNQLANIQVPEARMITITPWDASCLKGIEKAILTSDIGINPSNDGKMIRLVFPTLTEERRKDLVKQVMKYGEEAKVAIRNIRRDALDKFKSLHKSKEISDDDIRTVEEQVQKLTDKFVAQVEKVVQAKEKDLMEI